MKVSVIIPVYNVEPYITDCLESVRRQTLKDIEILCVNDASTDGSFEIVKKLAADDQRIQCFENSRNLGLASTRNYGLELARGQYVYFLDSDDMIRPEAMAQLYRRAVEDELDAVVFSSRFIYESEEMKERFSRDRSGFEHDYPGILTGKELFMRWMETWEWMPSQPRYFYDRSFLENNWIRFPDGMLHEDEIFAFDVLMTARRMRVVDEDWFIRRFRRDSIMSSVPTMKNVESCLEILQQAGEYPAEDEQLKKAVRFYMHRIFLESARKYRAVLESGQSVRLSERTEADPVKKQIFTLVEACGLWRE